MTTTLKDRLSDAIMHLEGYNDTGCSFLDEMKEEVRNMPDDAVIVSKAEMVRMAAKQVKTQQLLQSLLNRVNQVTSMWNYLSSISASCINQLSNRQIEVEDALKEMNK